MAGWKAAATIWKGGGRKGRVAFPGRLVEGRAGRLEALSCCDDIWDWGGGQDWSGTVVLDWTVWLLQPHSLQQPYYLLSLPQPVPASVSSCLGWIWHFCAFCCCLPSMPALCLPVFPLVLYKKTTPATRHVKQPTCCLMPAAAQHCPSTCPNTTCCKPQAPLRTPYSAYLPYTLNPKAPCMPPAAIALPQKLYYLPVVYQWRGKLYALKNRTEGQ